MPLVQGIKGTHGAPTHTATLPYGKCGIAYAGAKVASFHLEGDGASVLLHVRL
jgi:hypothetical protein